MKYIIGIDSGATSSEAIIVPISANGIANRKQTRTSKFPPINFNLLGFAKTAYSIVKIVRRITGKAGLENITSIAVGVSGARHIDDRTKLEKKVAVTLKFDNIRVYPDTEVAFASVFEPDEKKCGILIAGTGSVLYYKDSKGRINRVGGWGRHLGDEGSGYWIAREAVTAATKCFDGRLKNTRLPQMLKKKFGIDSENLVHEVYHNAFEISKVAGCVFDLAEQGETFSQNIIRRAAENLLDLIEPIRKSNYRIALTGSLFSEEKLLEKYFKAALKRRSNNLLLVKSKQKPVWGAVRLAERMAGVG